MNLLKEYNSMAFSALTTTTSVEFQKVFIAPPPRGTTLFAVSHSPWPPAWLLATTSLRPVSMALPILVISYKWDHTMCDLPYWAAFTQLKVLEVHSHVAVSVLSSFFMAE